MYRRTPSLLAPLLAGLALFLVCHTAASPDSPLFQRYMLGHWVSRMTTAMFCIGVTALAWALWHSRRELRQLSRLDSLLGLAPPPTLNSPDAAASGQNLPAAVDPASLLQRLGLALEAMPSRLRSHTLSERVANCVEFLEAGNPPELLQDRGNKLAEADLERQSARHALPRILVWAMPLLGFLGTVLGISAAMGQLEVGGESDLPRMMSGLQSNLNVAFDTTAQALVLSVILMFGVFWSERIESQLLGEVTARTDDLLAGLALLRRQPDPPAVAESPAVDLSAEIARLFEELADRCAGSWDQAMQRQFNALAAEPAPARRIEAALLELTVAVGQLQRVLNLQRASDEPARGIPPAADSSPAPLQLHRPPPDEPARPRSTGESRTRRRSA